MLLTCFASLDGRLTLWRRAPKLFQGDIFARFRTGLIQLGRGSGIDDFLLTESGK
jgi:hypothetical protein